MKNLLIGQHCRGWVVRTLCLVTALFLRTSIRADQSYDITLEPRGHWSAFSSSNSVLDLALSAPSEGKLYVTDGALQVLDITDPVNPAAGTRNGTIGSSQSLIVKGKLALVADAALGLDILDLRAPSAPVLLASSGTGATFNVALMGELIVTAGASGLDIIDVSEPGAPKRIGNYQTGNAAGLAVAVENSVAYIAEGWAGLEILDVSNARLPRRVGGLTSGADIGAVFGVTILGSNLLLLTDVGIEVWNASTSTAPKKLAVYKIDGLPGQQFRGMKILDHFAFVPGGWTGLHVIDLSVPFAPTRAAVIPTRNFAWGVAVSDDYAYVADGEAGVTAFKITRVAPSGPRIAAQPQDQIVLDRTTTTFQVRAEGTGPLSYQWSQNGTPLREDTRHQGTKGPVLTILDSGVSDLGNYSVLVSNALGTIESSSATLTVRNPVVPVPAGTWLGSNCVDVVVNNHIAFVADAQLGLVVLDVRDKKSPLAKAKYSVTDLRALRVVGSSAYLLGADGLEVLDIKDPWTPLRVGGTAVNGTRLSVVSPYVYIAGPDGLSMFEASDPTEPRKVSEFATPRPVLDVAATGGHAFISFEDGIGVIDLKDVSNPVLVGEYFPGGWRPSFGPILTTGNYLYALELRASLGGPSVNVEIFDISNPTSLVSIHTINSGVANAVSGKFFYSAGGQSRTLNGVEITDVGNADAPVVLGSLSWDVPWALPLPQGLAADQNAVYVAYGEGGLRIFEIAEQVRVELTKQDQSLSVTWLSSPGTLYELETSCDLEAWKPVSEPITAVSESTSALLSNSSKGCSFFRVQVLR